MKKIIKSMLVAVAILLPVAATIVGCKTNTPSPFVTLAVSTAVGVGIPIAAQYDPSIVPDLHIAYMSLNGVLNGASTNSASQVIALIGKSATNAATASAISNLVSSLSKWEQPYIAAHNTNAFVIEAQVAVAAWPPAYQ